MIKYLVHEFEGLHKKMNKTGPNVGKEINEEI